MDVPGFCRCQECGISAKEHCKKRVKACSREATSAVNCKDIGVGLPKSGGVHINETHARHGSIGFHICSAGV
jgi:hypothetical protein